MLEDNRFKSVIRTIFKREDNLELDYVAGQHRRRFL